MERRDLTESMAVLKQGGRYRDIDDKKLLALMERADFTPPPLPYDRLLDRIKRDGRNVTAAEISPGWFASFLRPRVLVPAFAALVLVAMTPFLWNRFYSIRDFSEKALCSFTFGEVTVVRNGVSAPAARGAALMPGDLVVTGGNSFADIGVGGDVNIRVKENSRLSIDHLTRSGHGNYHLAVEIPRGMVFFNFIKLSRGDMASVSTPTSVAVVRGTSFGVLVDEKSNTRFEVRSGKIRVRNRIASGADPAVRAVLDKAERADGAFLEAVVGPNQVCAVSRADHERVMRKVESILATGAPDAEKAIALAVREEPVPAVSSISGDAMMISGISSFTRETPGATRDSDIIELSVDVTPDGASVYLDGDLKGKGDMTLVTGKGVHKILVKADNHVDRIYEAPFSERKTTLRIGLESVRTASFNFRKWASSRDSSLVAYLERDGVLVNVSRTGLVEAIVRGNLRWSTDLGAAVTSPLIWDRDNIYAATSRENIVALARDSGRIRWSRQITGHLLFGAGMEYHEGHLYAGTSKGFLYKISPTGQVDWEKDLGSGIFVPPFASGQRLFVSANDGKLYQVNTGDGSITGSVRMGKIIGSSRVVRGDMMYLANIEGEIVGYDHAKSQTIWRYSTGSRMVHGPILDGDSLFAFTVSGDVLCLGLSGDVKWKTDLGNRIDMNPVVRGGEVFVISDRVLYVLDRGNGSVRWSYVIDARPTTSVIVADRRIMFGAEGRGLVVLRRD